MHLLVEPLQQHQLLQSLVRPVSLLARRIGRKDVREGCCRTKAIATVNNSYMKNKGMLLRNGTSGVTIGSYMMHNAYLILHYSIECIINSVLL